MNDADSTQLRLFLNDEKTFALRVGDAVYSDILPDICCFGLVVHVIDPGTDVVPFNSDYSFIRGRYPVSVGDPNYIILLGDTMLRVSVDVMKATWHLTETICSLEGVNDG
jgi:hypothetical protein